MTLKAHIQTEVKNAMRAQDKVRLGTLRLITSAIKQLEIDNRIEATDQDVLKILDKMASKHRDSIQQFDSAGRKDLSEKEQFELGIVTSFLPKPLTEVEIKTLIQEAIQTAGATSLRDMGAVMNDLRPKIQGRADMAKVSAWVKASFA